MIKVLFFAKLRETLQTEQLELSADRLNNVSDLIQQLQKKGDTWHEIFTQSHILMSVNQQMAKQHSTIKDGDEIAFFPPVTGG